METVMSDAPRPPSSAPSRAGIAINVALQVLLTATICLGVNWLSYRYFYRWDTSRSADYTLSSSTDNTLRRLNKDVEVTALFARGSTLYEDVHALLDEYRRANKDRIHVTFIDPARDLERTEQLKLTNGLTLQQNGLLVKANKGMRFIREDELVIQSPGFDSDHPTIDFRGEDALTSAIISLIEGTQKKFYFITGKGARAESSATDVLGVLNELGKQLNFDVAALNLSEISAFPADANGVLLIGPKYDLSEREVTLLRDYWTQRRAAMLVMLDPESQTQRLEQFLASNGILPRNDRVLFAESTSKGTRKEFSVQASFSRDSIITKPVRDATTTLAGQTQSLALGDDKLREQGLVVTPLITASPRYWGETAFFDDLPVVGEGDTQPPVHVAASVERGAAQDQRLRVDSARMVVVGNAALLDKQTRLAENQDFIAGSLNWMLNRERYIGIMPKRKHQYRLQLTDRQRELLFWITALLGPAVVLGFGMSVWAKRRAS